MSEFNFTAALLAAQADDDSTRQAAEAALNAFCDSNLPQFVMGLCKELGTEDKPDKARQLAGLFLKNLTVSRSEVEKKHLADRWLTIVDPVREHIYHVLMSTLGSPSKPVRSTAALVVAKLSAVEVAQGKWRDLVDLLVTNIYQMENRFLRQSSFEALGLVCEEIPSHLQAKSNPILNAISTGMKKEETDPAIKEAATTALCNSLEFARANFANPGERTLIMQMVFSAAVSEGQKVREIAYQCLHKIAFLYYDCLPTFMQVILDLTANALKLEVEAVQLQAIEFWSTICDVESDITRENEEARKGATPRVLHHFARGVLPQLLPLLLHHLTNQSDTLDHDTWSLAMAAGSCLVLLANCTQDEIVPHVLPFVQSHITSENWQHREAATLAFGALLEGPTREKLATLVTQALPLLLAQMADRHPVVKDTAAWTIGRVCNLLPETVSPEVLPKLMSALLNGLNEAPKIAANVCWAIHNMAQALRVPDGAETSPMSHYFEGMMRALLIVTERPHVGENNLLGAVWEAINSMIQSAAPDVYWLIAQIVPILIKRLSSTLERESADPKMLEVQGLLCAALQVVVTKLDDDVVLPVADTLMNLFLKVMTAKSATVLEEALVAVGALTNRTGANFEKYMGHFRVVLAQGLKAVKEHHLCVVSVGIVGDIARALELKMAPYCDEIMTILLAHLQNPEVERIVKPHIIACLGDIALAIGAYFDRYLPFVMKMLIQASQLKFELTSLDDFEYLQRLRVSILEAYTGILHGLGGDGKAKIMLKYMDKIAPFLDLVSKDEDRLDEVTRSAVGVIGDLASFLGKNVVGFLRLPSVINLVMTGLNSKEESTVKAAQWAKGKCEAVFKRPVMYTW